ncbi:MAG: hypothetical protein JNN16_14420 [Nitrospira sp.]|nr:hypothetical protein [Nitrospira sp.]
MSPSSLQSPIAETAQRSLFDQPLSETAVAALWRGQVIDAVTLVRKEQRIDLKEAKAAVEAYLRSQPALQRRIEKDLADARAGLLRWVLFFFIGGVGLLYFLM